MNEKRESESSHRQIRRELGGMEKGINPMVIGIFGESCTGKTTLAHLLHQAIGGELFAGKDYLRLAKSQSMAGRLFERKLREAVSGGHIIYVITEKAHLSMLPQGAIRILATAELDQIKERFAQRLQAPLPAAVEAMLERKHGCFDDGAYDIRWESGPLTPEEICQKIQQMVGA